MKAWVIEGVSEVKGKGFLKLVEFPVPEPEEKELVIKVYACGVCHTELDEIEGRAKPPFYPVIPGHQVVGKVVKVGSGVRRFKLGDVVGAGWIFSSCQKCRYCKKGLENLCPDFKATGKDAHGGYAEFFKIHEDYAFSIPESLSFEEAAPLFCAGAIGYRSLKLTGIGDRGNLGLVGFGASGHLVLKLVKAAYPEIKVFVFSHTEKNKRLAKELGAFWVGAVGDEVPELLDAVIDTTPVWGAPFGTLRYLRPGGRLVINAIRKEDKDKAALLELDYSRDLWMEKEVKSVANVCRDDIKDFLELAARYRVVPEIEVYSFEDAERALFDLKFRKSRGAKVLRLY